MLRLYARQALALTVSALALALITATPVPAATDVAQDPASATAPIEILGNAVPSAGGDANPRTMGENVAFENRAPAPATSIDFTWLFIDANGALVGEQRTSTRGRFASNVPVAGDAAAAAHVSGYTSGDDLYVADEDTRLFDPIDHVEVTVDNATFSDGSVWHGKARQSNALPPAMTFAPDATAAHIHITRIEPRRANSIYDHVDTLLSFANNNTKRIDAIEFTYAFYDLDNNVIFQQPAVVRGAYPHGAISTLNPATRVNFRGVVMNGGSVWVGWGSGAQYVAKIVAGVDAIQYSDGTTWNAKT